MDTKNFNKYVPSILSGLAVVGTAAIAYLSKRNSDTYYKMWSEKFSEKVDTTEQINNDDLEISKKEKVMIFVKSYWPTITATILTDACIIASNRISAAQITALTGSLALAGARFDEYRKQVLEEIGEIKEAEIRAKTADAMMRRNLDAIGLDDDGEQIFWWYEPFTKTFFEATKETVLSAMYDVNQRIIDTRFNTWSEHDYCGIVTMDRFFDDVGHPELKNEATETCGWALDQLNCDWDTYWVDFMYRWVEPGDDPSKPVGYFGIDAGAWPEKDIFERLEEMETLGII